MLAIEDNDIQEAPAAGAGYGQEEKTTAMVGTLICEVQQAARTLALTRAAGLTRAGTYLCLPPRRPSDAEPKDPLSGRALYKLGKEEAAFEAALVWLCTGHTSQDHVHEARCAWGAPRAASLALR
jgi:hypothetical protein